MDRKTQGKHLYHPPNSSELVLQHATLALIMQNSQDTRTEIRHTWQPLGRAPTGSMDATGPATNTLTDAASSTSSKGSPWCHLGGAVAAHRAQQHWHLVCCSHSCACRTTASSTWAATHLKLHRPLNPLGGRFCNQQSSVAGWCD